MSRPILHYSTNTDLQKVTLTIDKDKAGNLLYHHEVDEGDSIVKQDIVFIPNGNVIVKKTKSTDGVDQPPAVSILNAPNGFKLISDMYDKLAAKSDLAKGSGRLEFSDARLLANFAALASDKQANPVQQSSVSGSVDSKAPASIDQFIDSIHPLTYESKEGNITLLSTSDGITVLRERLKPFNNVQDVLTFGNTGRISLEKIRYDNRATVTGSTKRAGDYPDEAQAFKDLYAGLVERDKALNLGGKLEPKSVEELTALLDKIGPCLPEMQQRKR